MLSIFNVINPAIPHMYAAGDSEGLFAGYFSESHDSKIDQYSRWNGFLNNQQDIMQAQALLEFFEDCFSSIPSPLSGVSCYHWGKTLASIAVILSYNRNKTVNKEKAFALYSIDFSGIQSFIYTIISAGALKALKTRSLYLTVLLEHICDMILSQCGFPRSNLIYAGGGRAHFLLSSDPAIINQADKVVSGVNHFLKKNFGTSLYLASGWTEAGENELHSDGGKRGSFSELFRTTSRIISRNKLRRYSYSEIKELNQELSDAEGRTCAICGRSSRIVSWKDRNLCRSCARMETFSSGMTDECDKLIVVGEEVDSGLPVPGPNGEVFSLAANSVSSDKIIREYTINSSDASSSRCVRIFLSRHHADPAMNGTPSTFADMADASEGIKRLGVFRGDVDGLGLLFAKGFVRDGDEDPWKYCNISYYSSLSGALTWFFQRNLDKILQEDQVNPLLKAKPAGRHVTVVYSGGDDVFLVGAWNDVLDMGLRIHNAFRDYTGGVVTMSGGYSFFPEKTPIPIMAGTTADLENYAKQMDGKDAIVVFGTDSSINGNTVLQSYHWDEFSRNVLDEKLSSMKNLFEKLEDKGNSFLYRVLGYFRETQNDPMAITRLAYLLARHKPSDVSDELVKIYNDFMKKIYKWSLEPEENLAFRTACLIYVYLNRKTNIE